MQVRMLAKDTSSGEHGCPAVYIAESREAVVQGPAVDADTVGNLSNVLPGEVALRIDLQVIADAYRKAEAEGLL